MKKAEKMLRDNEKLRDQVCVCGGGGGGLWR
jgi:hypothetical protein